MTATTEPDGGEGRLAWGQSWRGGRDGGADDWRGKRDGVAPRRERERGETKRIDRDTEGRRRRAARFCVVVVVVVVTIVSVDVVVVVVVTHVCSTPASSSVAIIMSLPDISAPSVRLFMKTCRKNMTWCVSVSRRATHRESASDRSIGRRRVAKGTLRENTQSEQLTSVSGAISSDRSAVDAGCAPFIGSASPGPAADVVSYRTERC